MTSDQLESIRAARLQLLDHGDTQAASLLDWAVTAEPAIPLAESEIGEMAGEEADFDPRNLSYIFNGDPGCAYNIYNFVRAVEAHHGIGT
ncbi:MAG: hypothetical protein EBR82_09680 [Caulobacteraceae bacterium]|nr:hypothetical protein [Caulobacteraceae bacterium]